MEDTSTVEHATVNGWTRAKNDHISTSYDASRHLEMFKYITYSPTYLQEGSCLAGNSANCATFRSQDTSIEPRIGKLSNLNEIQRSFTNNQALGILTSPDFSSGKPIDDTMLKDRQMMEPLHTYTSRVTDIDADSIMNQRFMDDHRSPREPPALIPREETRVSTRVVRRNSFATACAKN
jgi:hypothetical protein